MNFAEHHQRPLVEALLHWSPAKVSKDETGKHVLLDLENTGLKTISEDIRSVTPSLHLSILLSLFLYPIPSKSVLRIGRCSHLHCSYILLSSMQKPLPKSVQIRVSYTSGMVQQVQLESSIRVPSPIPITRTCYEVTKIHEV